MNSDNQSDYPKKVFFLGAGASALAGVPTFVNFDKKAEDICNKKLLDDESNKQFERVLRYWKKNFDCNIEEFYEAVEMRETLDDPDDKGKQDHVTTVDIEKLIYFTIQESIKNRFLFSWDEIPENHNEKLKNFLIQNFNFNWVKNAEIEKIDSGSTIKVFTKEKSLSLRLQDQTYLILIMDDFSFDKFIVKIENGTQIYKRDDVHDLYESFLTGHIDPPVFITTNWDTVLETSSKKNSIENGRIRYEGVQLYNEIKSNMHKPYSILKLHGSLNWRFCKKCGDIYYFDGKIHESSKGEECKKCSGKLDLILVPPKLSKLIKPEQNNSEPKDDSNREKSPYYPMRYIWSKASEYIKWCEELYFIGYSFPETDVQMKVFISDALRQNSNLNKLIIVSSPKHGSLQINFEDRYLSIFKRFIKPSKIKFYYYGFEGCPKNLIDSIENKYG